jgi:hypothetical protein
MGVYHDKHAMVGYGFTAYTPNDFGFPFSRVILCVYLHIAPDPVAVLFGEPEPTRRNAPTAREPPGTHTGIRKRPRKRNRRDTSSVCAKTKVRNTHLLASEFILPRGRHRPTPIPPHAPAIR